MKVKGRACAVREERGACCGWPEDRSSAGSALIAVLWVLLLLSVMALGYARSTRQQTLARHYQAEALSQRYSRDSAFIRGIQEYETWLKNRSLLAQREEVEALTGKSLELWFPRYEPWLFEFDGATFAVQLRLETGRFDPNRLSVVLWDQILLVCGLADEERRLAVRDALLDWGDSDEAHHLQGVESEHYLQLEPAYRSKNNGFQSLSEMLLVRGVTPELYYGTARHPGLIDLLSVYGQSERLDVNTAAPASFWLISTLTEEELQAILQLRQFQPIANLAELAEALSIDSYSQLQHYFGVVPQAAYVTIAVSRWPTDTPPYLWEKRTFKAAIDGTVQQ